MCVLDLFVFKHINFLTQKLKIVIEISPIIAQYLAPLKHKSALEGRFCVLKVSLESNRTCGRKCKSDNRTKQSLAMVVVFLNDFPVDKHH